MKNIILLLLVLPMFVAAKNFPGTITLNDRTVMTGDVDMPSYYYTQSIKIVTRDGKKEKYSINDVKGFEVYYGGNEKVSFLAVAVKSIKKDGTLKGPKEKAWGRIIKTGKILMLSMYGGEKSYPINQIFLKWPNEDFAIGLFTFFGMNEQSDLIIPKGNLGFKYLYKVAKTIFETRCPKLLEVLHEEDFLKNEITKLVDLYDENCE